MSKFSTSTAKSLAEILELLVRTMRTLSLYEARNPVSEKLEAALHARFTSLLDEEGALELKILHHQILFEGEVVYENRERKESLAFLVARDGIRSLVFRPRLSVDELRRFVTCLNRARVLVGDEDDLTTLLWDQDFQWIDYFAIEELTDGVTGEELSESLVGTGWSGASEPESAGNEAGDKVDLGDVRLAAQLPVENVRLTKSELDAIYSELAEESAADPVALAVDLAVELVLLEPDPDEQGSVAETLAQILDGCEPKTFLQGLDRLANLAEVKFAAEDAVATLFETIRHAVAHEAQLNRFFSAVDGQPALLQKAADFLVRLPSAALPTLIAQLGMLRQRRLRRAVSRAILVHGERGPGVLLDQLEAQPVRQDEVVGELLFMVRGLPEESACPLLERLLHSGDAELAHRAALILGHFGPEHVERVFLDLLETAESEMRSLAVVSLARGGNRALAPLLLRKMEQPGSPEAGSEDSHRALAAIARLGGDSMLPHFDELLQTKSRGWFPTREKRQRLKDLIHALRAVGSTSAEAYLENLAVVGNRRLRRACREEVSGRSR